MNIENANNKDLSEELNRRNFICIDKADFSDVLAQYFGGAENWIDVKLIITEILLDKPAK